jgi:hypothetical protein
LTFDIYLPSYENIITLQLNSTHFNPGTAKYLLPEQLNNLKKMNPLWASILTATATCAPFHHMNQPGDSKVWKRFWITPFTKTERTDFPALMTIIAFFELVPPKSPLAPLC